MIARRTRESSRTTSEGAISPRDRGGGGPSSGRASGPGALLTMRGGQALLPVAEAAHHFLLDVAHELVHLVLHLGHALAQVEDDLDAREVDAELAREREDRLEAFEIFIRVEAGVAIGARRTQQALALVETQRLRMDVVALGDRADHVQRLAWATGGHRSAFRLHRRDRAGQVRGSRASPASPPRHPTRPPHVLGMQARELLHQRPTAARRSPAAAPAALRARDRRERRCGATARRVRAGAVAARTGCPPARAPTPGHRRSAPSTRAPSTASCTATGSVMCRSLPTRVSRASGATRTRRCRSPGGPPRAPACPSPGCTSWSPSARPGGNVTVMVCAASCCP